MSLSHIYVDSYTIRTCILMQTPNLTMFVAVAAAAVVVVVVNVVTAARSATS